MKRHLRLAMTILSIVILSFFLFSCSKKAKLTALNTGTAISSITSTATSTGATITWATSTAASSQVAYGTTTSFGTLTTEKDTGASMSRSHSVTLPGLHSGTKYYYKVISKDSSQNTSQADSDSSGDSLTFTTTATGPVISAVTPTPTTNSATITWTTDVPSTSKVFYGTTNTFGSSQPENTTLTTSHSVTLPSLTTGVTYYYYVYSKNAAGNASTLGDDGSKSFSTSSVATGTTFYLYIDDIQLEGTGTPYVMYDDKITDGTFTMGTNNIAYMGSPNNGADNIASIDTACTDSPHSGTKCIKVTMNDSAAAWWAGNYFLGTGTWRVSFAGTETIPNLSGPTGAVKLTCWAKISNNKTPSKLKIGIGDDSGKNNSVPSVDSVPGSNVGSAKLAISDTWTKLELSLGSNPNLTSVNGVFYWAIDSADLP